MTLAKLRLGTYRTQLDLEPLLLLGISWFGIGWKLSGTPTSSGKCALTDCLLSVDFSHLKWCWTWLVSSASIALKTWSIYSLTVTIVTMSWWLLWTNCILKSLGTLGWRVWIPRARILTRDIGFLSFLPHTSLIITFGGIKNARLHSKDSFGPK